MRAASSCTHFFIIGGLFMGLFSKKVIAEKAYSVWGTAYTNENGTSRQTYIAKLKVGEDLQF